MSLVWVRLKWFYWQQVQERINWLSWANELMIQSDNEAVMSSKLCYDAMKHNSWCLYLYHLILILQYPNYNNSYHVIIELDRAHIISLAAQVKPNELDLRNFNVMSERCVQMWHCDSKKAHYNTQVSTEWQCLALSA